MEALIGIDPDATVEVSLRGATFIVGVLDAATWERLNHRFGVAYRDAQRRAIAEVGMDNENEMAVPLAMAVDPKFTEERFEIWTAAARRCIRGHKGLIKKDKTEVAFTTDRTGEVAEITMRWYALLPGLMEQVWYSLRSLHTLEENEKKDSPPVSSPTGGSSPVVTVSEFPSSQS